MDSKKVLTKEELLEELGGLGDDSNASGAETTIDSTSKPAKAEDDDDDALEELERIVPRGRQSTSRPETPHIAPSSTTTSTRTRSPAKAIHTPQSSGSGRSSEEKPTSSNPVPPPVQASAKDDPPVSVPKDAVVSGGSWWGGLTSFATAAKKQAEAAYKEIQRNEEAQKWAEQMKGNVGALRGLGDELRSRALPTFTNILHTIAPPISQHERLQVHIAHDLVGYPSIDPLVYNTFSRVMQQVEGGDLLVIQRGLESKHRRISDAAYAGRAVGSASGWNDGPWWRENNPSRSLNAVKGLTEGTKLVRANAEAYGTEFFSSRGGIEEAARKATEGLSESNPVRTSDIFLAIQPISYSQQGDLFGGSQSIVAPVDKEKGVDIVVDESSKADDLVRFAVFLHDPVHVIEFKTLSQTIPQKWVDWLDAKTAEPAEGEAPLLPEEIAEIVDSGGVDPREWVAEWMEESLKLAIGIVAQRYVARRMGVGEGGMGKGKGRAQVVESGGGEAARAI